MWDQIPPHLQAAIWIMVAGYERRIVALEAEVGELKGEIRALKEHLGQNSQNSSRPPSSDGPQVKRKPPRAPLGRKRGAQPGHPLHQRALLPVEQVQEGIVRKPLRCRRCGEALPGSDPAPLRQQVLEVPPVIRPVTEYQWHRLVCARCGLTPCGTLPPGVPPVG